ncbi:hypothetical protein [Aquirhabdus parva]|uniref:hypothetical protein n=1 Tax=Aquirhabdus parva TaxID=2283318 RepID=UPI0013B46ABD|nr:hypothetical protein [Aquirhabdus parva]
MQRTKTHDLKDKRILLTGASSGIDIGSEQVINPDIAKRILLDKRIQDSSQI